MKKDKKTVLALSSILSNIISITFLLIALFLKNSEVEYIYFSIGGLFLIVSGIINIINGQIKKK